MLGTHTARSNSKFYTLYTTQNAHLLPENTCVYSLCIGCVFAAADTAFDDCELIRVYLSVSEVYSWRIDHARQIRDRYDLIHVKYTVNTREYVY